MKIPCAERLPFVVSGLAFLQLALTNCQFYNLTLIATALVLGSKFCLSEINRMDRLAGRDLRDGATCGTFLDMLITYFSIVLICFLLQFFHRGLRIGLL